LDAHVRGILRYELRRLVNELGLTAIHVTHDQEEAMSISDRLVIMKAGQVVEVGTPAELYLSPKRLFTANFLGETNLVPAKVEDCDQGHVTALVNGWKVDSQGSGFTKGQSVVLAVRPESVIVNPIKQADHEWVGTARERILLGDCVRTDLELDNGLHMIAHAINEGAEPVRNIGERVSVDFVKDGLIAYQIPAHGLDVELALE
jgi:putative spermidine/putrescine transport system ATP-binding protein